MIGCMNKNFQQTGIAGLIIVLLALQHLSACLGGGNSRKKEPGKENSPEASSGVYKKPPSGYNDTLIIDTKSAVFFNSDSLQMEKIKAIRKKDDFETEEHYCIYLMKNAQLLLKKHWPQIHIIETSMARFLLFIKQDKSKQCIDLNSKGDMCGIFLFDRKKDPAFIDMMNLDTELAFYFSK